MRVPFLTALLAIHPVAAIDASNGTPTTSSAPLVTSLNLTVEDLWNIYIGPVETAAVNSTVEPTPIPSSQLIPPPQLYYPSYLTGAQIPAQGKNDSWSFPKGFWWGVTSASYQVEGAVKADGRGPSIWDAFTHRAMNVADNQTGDVAINQYYTYKEDIQRIAAMGVKAYSFSISWSRIFPFGNGPINEAGLQHYDDVIDTCLEYGVQPQVTLYHWDLPLFLQLSYGGWTSEKIVNDYLAYARVLLTRWGGKVAQWYTFNEPISFCGEYPVPDGYFTTATTIPAHHQKFWCGHYMLLAAGKTYHLARSLNITAPISVKNNGGYKLPRTNSSADAEAVERAWAFNEGWFADPLFLGDYPARLKNFTSSFLPEFTAAEKSLIQGASDYFAHDAYTAAYYMAPDAGIEGCLADPSNSLYPQCYNSTYTLPASEGGWLIGPASDPNTRWLHKATEWLPAFLHYIQRTWQPANGIVITEFGWTEPFEAYKSKREDILTDPVRSAYYRDYVEAMLIAVAEGVNLVGCLAWSIADNLEWTAGFTVKFGLQYVNLTTQERFYKASFFELASLFKTYIKE
ncbi:glycoside hydrolase family 1 protein [Aspergillus brunneoviolaceus CBS 621.78]|uniref:Glycoside hydrolase n=1 Tax=Aspergillus brunneoviolaceus CBS 621.78 TaxID=1450534 RepID=A0ACD1GCH7_9EURO|nr:glycoside hydrolase [Aspergillus brunneoviolaceus CBS 621.78]RAH46907.1 glycoside hydrolase [Aspergillus brunneoviolaceus CBS 621.78]